MQAYLASGMVPGIGPSLASAIVSTFRERTFEIIESEPERLHEVPGIGENRIAVIRSVWHEHSAVRNLIAFRQAQNLPPSLAFRLYKAFGPAAPQIVQSDPYRLTEVRGVGFKTADRIAARAGLPREAAERLEAAAVFTLNKFADQGHSYMPREQLVNAAAELLELPGAAVAAAVDYLAATGGKLRLERELALPHAAIYTVSLHRLERETAERLLALARHQASAIQPLRSELAEEQIHWVASMAGQTELSGEQRLAIRRAVENKLSVIAGGPGTGKTICLRSLVGLVELYHFRCALVSPTGRAAKRLAEATGHAAHTVHRLLNYTGGSFSEELIDAEMVIVDEASMLDLGLTRQLLLALRLSTHLVLVGDVDQLPAVGPGMVLRDIIAAGIAAVTRLTHIFRQAHSSLIVTNAHRINHGLMPLTPQSQCDFYFFRTQHSGEAADWVVDLASQRIPEQFGASLGLSDPLRDVQVLAPMYKGRTGVDRLNARMQAVLNPRPGTRLSAPCRAAPSGWATR